MIRTTALRWTAATASVALVGLGLSACSAASGDGSTQISYAVQNDPVTVDNAEAIADAFMKKNPDVTVTVNPLPTGADGENLTKTRLATGEMDDVFLYPSGSLLQALNPDQTLVDLSDDEWINHANDEFLRTVSTDEGVYGTPLGTSLAGGIIYSIPVYEQLGLQIPTSWDELIANSEKIKRERPDVSPVLQAYGSGFTSQFLVLADFANVSQADPEWADKYTDNKVKFADEPAVAGFEHLQEIHDLDLLNEDYPTLENEEAVARIAQGTAAQYPMFTNVVGILDNSYPDLMDDVGYFALPATDAANTAATVWQPNALYIARSAEGDELEAAKSFVEFVSFSDEACDLAKSDGVPSGPFVTDTCESASDVPQIVKDLQGYFDSGKTGSALEYLSPVKGPNLENIAIEVGSGISSAEDGAASYDQDVKKQAQQLGLDGW